MALSSNCRLDTLNQIYKSSKAECHSELHNHLACLTYKSGIVVIPCLIPYQEKIISWSPCPANTTVESYIIAAIIVLSERAPCEVGYQCQIQPQAGNADIKNALGASLY